jgi:S1-C subfamily serine protease
MTLIETIKDIKPSVVKIGIYVINQMSQQPTFVSLGSGFVISKDGYVFTCEHVIRPIIQNGFNKCLVCFEKGNLQLDFFEGNILKYDAQHDFAILKISKSDLSKLELGDFNSVEEGEETIFSGYPLNVARITTHRGMVSAKGDDIIPSNRINILQIDGSVNNGNSGGPLLNKDGKVIGIVASKYSEFNKYLENILSLGKMTGVSIGGSTGTLDIGEAFFNITTLIKSHVNVGIGHAISIEYAKNAYDEIIQSYSNQS